METIIEIFKNTVIQFAWILAALSISAAILSRLARWTSNIHRQFIWPRFGLYVFGAIGVPVHELSHALFCKIFRLEIKNIKWFDPKGKDGSHGAVEHLFEPTNPWHRLGHVFIGFAPVLIGPLLLLALFYFLVPGSPSAHAIWQRFDVNTASDLFRQLPLVTTPVTHGLLAASNFTSPTFYVFIYLAFCILSQLDLSKEDLRLARGGFVGSLTLLFFVNAVAVVFDADLHVRFTHWGLALLLAWVGILGMAVALSITNLICCYIFMNALNRLFGKPSIQPFQS